MALLWAWTLRSFKMQKDKAGGKRVGSNYLRDDGIITNSSRAA
jgi:hypothetical protein